jgi:hypothetical protein
MIYFYNTSQRDALFLKFVLIKSASEVRMEIGFHPDLASRQSDLASRQSTELA